jgi:hypothetical protein
LKITPGIPSKQGWNIWFHLIVFSVDIKVAVYNSMLVLDPFVLSKIQSITALHQFPEVVREAGSRRAVDDVVVKAERYVQVLADFYTAVHYTRFLGNAA